MGNRFRFYEAPAGAFLLMVVCPKSPALWHTISWQFNWGAVSAITTPVWCSKKLVQMLQAPRRFWQQPTISWWMLTSWAMQVVEMLWQSLRSHVTSRAKMQWWNLFFDSMTGLEAEKQLVSGAFAAGVTCILWLAQFYCWMWWNSVTLSLLNAFGQGRDSKKASVLRPVKKKEQWWTLPAVASAVEG